MSLFTTSAVRARAKQGVPYNFSAANVLTERMQKQASVIGHDIFLSHAFDDKELILGVALMLEDLGYSVYLDWRDDPLLDRKNVNRSTALKLRERMRNSKCLFFATTENTVNSKWMPWELGFKDGHSSQCAILPVSDYSTTAFEGREYLAIYPYVTRSEDTEGKIRIWIRWDIETYVAFDAWLNGVAPYKR